MADWADNEEIKIFQEYLRIPSVHPDIDYEPCIEFIKRQVSTLDGLSLRIYYPSGDRTKPLVVVTWLGSEPQLPSILLTSHMDVVPVYEKLWTHPPFGAEIDAEGRIYGRGSQDMKSVGTQYLAAVRSMIKDGVVRLKRAVYIMFTPDEETGSNMGAEMFTKMPEFVALNVGLTLDEGAASPNDTFVVYYAERTAWKVQFKVHGNTGDASHQLESTASDKLLSILSKFSEFRQSELNRLKNSEGKLLNADVTTVNLTMIKGGIQENLISPFISMTYDIRLAIDVNLDDFESTIKHWATEAGSDIEVIFTEKEYFVAPSDVSDANPFWVKFKSILVDELNYSIKPQVSMGSSDSRFTRALGIPTFGFSPINNTPILLHDHDEFLNAETYIKGIAIYKRLIEGLASV